MNTRSQRLKAISRVTEVAAFSSAQKQWVNQFCAGLRKFGVKFTKVDIRINGPATYICLNVRNSQRFKTLLMKDCIKELLAQMNGEIHYSKIYSLGGHPGANYLTIGVSPNDEYQVAPSIIDYNGLWGDLYIQF